MVDLEGPSVASLFVGSVIGVSVGCTVGRGFVGKSVGASVALENHSEQEYDEYNLPLSLNEGTMDNQSETYDEYRLLSLNGPIDENEYTVLSLNETIEPVEPMGPIELKEPIEPIELKEPIENKNPEVMEPMEEPRKPMKPIELKEPIEPIELKGRIEENAEAYDECTLIDDPVDIEDAKSEAYDECKLLLPSLEELVEELENGCTLIDDPVDTEEEKSEAYKILLPSPDELIELTNAGNNAVSAGVVECSSVLVPVWTKCGFKVVFLLPTMVLMTNFWFSALVST